MTYFASIRTTARVAGLLYLLQIPLGVFGLVYMPTVLFAPGNLDATIANVLAHEFTFRLSIVSTILCALVTIATAVLIADVLRAVDKRFAKAIVVCTLIAAPISILNELNNVAVLLLAKHPEGKTAQDLIPLFVELHQYGVQLVGIFFGLWLLPMGYLVIKSEYMPKLIGYLLLMTCGGYLIDFTTWFLFPDVGVKVSEYTWLGELLMVLWLLVKGVNTNKYNERLNPALVD